MKRLIILLLTAALLLPCAAYALTLPEDSGVFDPALAALCVNGAVTENAEKAAALYEQQGFGTVLQAGYDKAADDPAHTCAWTLTKGTAERGDETRVLYVLNIRGTAAGEWYANFDIAPGAHDDPVFAENFLFAAEDVLLGIREPLLADPDACWLITGYSRGAACACLLGLMVNELHDPALVYVYTGAAPAVIRGEVPVYGGNIFNLIDPGDIVPKMPPAAWGFFRPGTDIVLPGDKLTAKRLDSAVAALVKLAPGVGDYYGKRYDPEGPGESDTGLSVFDLITVFAKALTGMTLNTKGAAVPGGGTVAGIAEDSDLTVLTDRLTELAEKPAAAKLLLQHHMPDNYAALLEKYMKENGLK